MIKQRADILLVEQGLCSSRAQAQRLIMAGSVRTGPDAVVRKPGDMFAADTPFHVDAPCPYVSRGAYKLAAALDAVQPALAGLVALDIGASTGGFTDLLLQRGVRKVYAVDVGHGQLHQRLREDPRVVCHEGLNARHLDATHVPEPVDILTADVSFISLRLALPAPARRVRANGWAFVLIKPQFEAGRTDVGKGGVVRSDAVRQRCIAEICAFAESALGWTRVTVVPSPLLGPAGNQEYVGVFRTGPPHGRADEAVARRED